MEQASILWYVLRASLAGVLSAILIVVFNNFSYRLWSSSRWRNGSASTKAGIALIWFLALAAVSALGLLLIINLFHRPGMTLIEVIAGFACAIIVVTLAIKSGLLKNTRTL